MYTIREYCAAFIKKLIRPKLEAELKEEVFEFTLS